MDNTNYTTEHRKGQHLSGKERQDIEVHLKDGWSIYKIAKHLGRPYNTIKNEIRRGMITSPGGRVTRYDADAGNAVYMEHRQHCYRRYRTLEVAEFLRYVVSKFRGIEQWSLDACVGNALRDKTFSRDQMVCTKTLYRYVDLGMLPIRNIDLPEKLRRNTKAKKNRENKKKLGTSIEERPKDIDTREEFGHWELDSVLGIKGAGESVVITMVERKLRMCLWLKARDHSAEAANETLKATFDQFGDRWHEVFKTITTDNGSEFAKLTDLEDGQLRVYFAHPYTSCEKGTNECHNRMLRRFLPKGKSISDYTADDICFFADCINGLPRKILGYATPEELFEAELDRIYAA